MEVVLKLWQLAEHWLNMCPKWGSLQNLFRYILDKLEFPEQPV